MSIDSKEDVDYGELETAIYRGPQILSPSVKFREKVESKLISNFSEYLEVEKIQNITASYFGNK